jgi:hypothetical protein
MRIAELTNAGVTVLQDHLCGYNFFLGPCRSYAT